MLVPRNLVFVCVAWFHPVGRTSPEPQSLVLRSVTAILTLPTNSRRLRLFSLFVNTLLLLTCIEFATEDYLYDAPDVVFTRLGAIYPDKVKLAIRYPHHKDPIHIVWRKVRESSDMQAQPWTLGPPVMLSEVGDWVNSTTVSPLWPNTIYECKKSSSHFASILCFSSLFRFVGFLGQTALILPANSR